MTKSLPMKNTKYTPRTSWNLCALCVTLLLFAAVANAQQTAQKPRIICDHAAPPRGMHYVCKSQCDCHLEGKLKNDEDGVESITGAGAIASKSCTYGAPKPGELLVCDSECVCKKPAQPDQSSAIPFERCEQPVTIVPPVYPPIARTSALEGIVFLNVVIDPDGKVNGVNAFKGHPSLAAAAEQAVRKWRFGSNCRDTQTVHIRFRITKDPVDDQRDFLSKSWGQCRK
jgi:TonB family protein